MTTRICWLDFRMNEVRYPIRDKNGYLVLGDPKCGNEKHHAKNKVKTKDEEEAIDLVKHHNHSIWVGTDSAPSLVNRNLYIDHQAVR